MSGPAVNATALANVKMMRDCLSPEISVVGVGGVSSGVDAFAMLLCGASAVQVGTCHWVEGAGCFRRIEDELLAIMRGKGYTSIDEFRGKVKAWSKEGAAASRKANKGKGSNEASAASSSAIAAKSQPFNWMVFLAILVVVGDVLFWAWREGKLDF